MGMFFCFVLFCFVFWSKSRNLTHALRQDITERQREYMILYYGRNLSMEAIAKQCGVNKSTVSRTLKRGRQRLYRCLRYGAANLLEQAES